MSRQSKHWIRALFVLLGVWCGLLELGVVAWPGFDGDIVLGDYAHNVIEVLAGVLCLLGARRRGRERLAWSFIGVGVLAWALGNLYYTIFLYDLAQAPIPSPADGGFLLFPALALIGIVLLVRARAHDVPKALTADGAIAALAVMALSAAIVVTPALDGAEGKPLVVATGLAYPLLDLVLIGVILGALARTGWRLDRTWLPLALGVGTFWLADTLYLLQTANGSYTPPAWFDLGWTIGLLLIARAAWQPADRRRPAPPEGLRFIAVPLCFGGIGLGILCYASRSGINAVAAALAAASLGAVMVRLLMTFRENVSMLRTSRIEALTDALTGLGNRRALGRELEQALPRADDASPLVLVLFDLDGFKHYNDTFGHPAGDALLIRLGASLQTYLTGRGRAYRMGGDEFCALFEPGEEVAHPIIAGAGAALTEHGQGFSVTCSFGAVVLPREAEDAAEAVRIADQRMYAQKNSGRISATRQSKDVLLRALAERDPDLSSHIQAVAGMAEATARNLGLPEVDVEEIRHAAELHDVGKVAIPDTILQKPGALEPEEWEFIRRHTLIGERIIAAAPALTGVASLVRWSHERWDGTGYPDGLAERGIPIGARVIAVADAFDAMTSSRPYSPPKSPEQSLEELRRSAGTQFDPVVVEAFCAAWAERAAAVPA